MDQKNQCPEWKVAEFSQIVRVTINMPTGRLNNMTSRGNQAIIKFFESGI
jgi:hypothetical protein